MSDVLFTFDGTSVRARSGLSLAAALTEAGYNRFRHTMSGDMRGMFCGMGVCQDCLLTIDGTPNVRACMTVAGNGMDVRTQEASASLSSGNPNRSADVSRLVEPDILVIGGGAGGLNAAIAARRKGASVTVLDERKIAGGQYFKQGTHPQPLDQQQAEGAELLEAAHESGAEILSGVEIWGAFDGPLFLAGFNGGALIARPRIAIVATGAYERPRIVPGWTLPGVMTTGAAQTLWRSYGALPGKSVAVCGSGPLNLQVALELAEGGAEVKFVAERAPNPLTRPIIAAQLAMADAGLARKGLGMLRALRARRIPVHYGTELLRIDQKSDRLRTNFSTGNGREIACDIDALCMNDGFEPQNEILRLLGARMTFDNRTRQLRCWRGDTMETSVAGLYAAGDCAGTGGAPAAMIEGRIAGRAAAAALGYGEADDSIDREPLLRQRRFQDCLWELYSPKQKALSEPPDDALICRCEEITFGQARSELQGAAGDIGKLKRATRIGMGRCQGRYCGPVAARLMAAASGMPIEDQSFFAPRVPTKPVCIGAVLAAYEALDGDL